MYPIGFLHPFICNSWSVFFGKKKTVTQKTSFSNDAFFRTFSFLHKKNETQEWNHDTKLKGMRGDEKEHSPFCHSGTTRCGDDCHRAAVGMDEATISGHLRPRFYTEGSAPRWQSHRVSSRLVAPTISVITSWGKIEVGEAAARNFHRILHAAALTERDQSLKKIRCNRRCVSKPTMISLEKQNPHKSIGGKDGFEDFDEHHFSLNWVVQPP